MMIKWIQQPEGSSLCGQTCVAMIAGVTLEESIEAFGGKRSGTRTKDVVIALRKLGINGQCYPDTCIVKLHFDGQKNTHWTIWHEGKFYDPEAYHNFFLNEFMGGNKYWEGVRQTSYLPIFM
jgi:hypothetical protein